MSRVAIIAAMLLILGVPFFLRPPADRAPDPSRTDTLIVVTPHVAQIRTEFAEAFDRWRLARGGGGGEGKGRHTRIDWRIPGGTTEIRKQLEAQYIAEGSRLIEELKRSDPAALADPAFSLADRFPKGSMGTDIFLGGGSYDHTGVKQGIEIPYTIPGKDGKPEPRRARVPISAPAGFSQQQLDNWFGPNTIGPQKLYDPGDPAKNDPGQYWIGNALSSFGIVYSKDVLERLGLKAPGSFRDLGDPRYSGWIALADPRQSGSVTTSFESILNSQGWDDGWKTIRSIAANTRSYTNSSTKPPIDVAQGEAAAGLAIDFYGRTQSQAVVAPGADPESSRVGYIDPRGAVYIDADPVSILRGAPNPELAREFVEFCLSEEGQALWQFPAETDPRSKDNPIGADGQRLGPIQYELRRLPIRRVMYEKYLPYFIDKVNPFEIVSEAKPRGWRNAIGIMMGAFAIDIADEQRAAWAALDRARREPAFPREKLAEMESLFFSWPDHAMADGRRLPFSEANFAEIEKDAKKWRDPDLAARLRLGYTQFFRDQYARVVALGRAARDSN